MKNALKKTGYLKQLNGMDRLQAMLENIVGPGLDLLLTPTLELGVFEALYINKSNPNVHVLFDELVREMDLGLR